MNESPLLVARGLAKSYVTGGNTVSVLRGVDLALHAGDQVAIVGRSGSGKSTLLHVLGMLDRPDEGTLMLRGEDPFAGNDEQLARIRNRSVGFVFQFHHLLVDFSALENVMMPALIAEDDPMRAREKAAALLCDVGLDHRLHHRPSELSGGEQQRVAIARAIMQHPALLFADEPLGSLDARTARGVGELLVELAKRYGMTLVVVTHEEAFAGWFSRVYELRDGFLTERP